MMADIALTDTQDQLRPSANSNSTVNGESVRDTNPSFLAQPQHRGVFTKNRAADHLEAASRGSLQRAPQQGFANPVPLQVGPNNQRNLGLRRRYADTVQEACNGVLLIRHPSKFSGPEFEVENSFQSFVLARD